MIKQFSGTHWVYELNQGFHSAYGGLSPRIDVWKGDENGKRITWQGAYVKTEIGVAHVGNPPIIMDVFATELLELL